MTFGLPQPSAANRTFFPAGGARAFVAALDKDAPILAVNDLWSIAEVAVLRENAHLGIRRLEYMLPNRTCRAIRQKVYKCGLRIGRVPRRRGYKVMARRGKIKPWRGVHPLVKQFIAAANKQKMTLTEIETLAGLGAGTCGDWRRGNPRLDTFAAAVNALGLDLRIEPLSTVKD